MDVLRRKLLIENLTTKMVAFRDSMDATALVAEEPTMVYRIGTYAGALIRSAAELSGVDGLEKHEAVRETLKAMIFGEHAGEKEMEDFVDKLLPLSGIAEALSDAAIKMAPVEKIVDSILDLVIKSAYNAMKAVGIAL